MDDLISRQSAIDAIAKCTNCGDEKTLRAYVAKHSLDNGWTGGVLQALDAVKELPSAQPEHMHTVMQMIKEKYEKAMNTSRISNPMAWALYQTWKEYAR